jgi:large subunit ribosomal protein L2
MALKTFNPTTPGQRQLVMVDRSALYKGKPVKALTEGKITRPRPQQHRPHHRALPRRRPQAAYRMVDFKRRKFDVPATVERLEYDPNRTAFIALIKYQDGELAYILAPQRLAGDTVVAGNYVDVKPGNAMPLGNMPVGTIVHNVEMKPARAARSRVRPAPTPSSSAATRATSSAPELGRAAPGARPCMAPSARCRTPTT